MYYLMYGEYEFSVVNPRGGFNSLIEAEKVLKECQEVSKVFQYFIVRVERV